MKAQMSPIVGIEKARNVVENLDFCVTACERPPEVEPTLECRIASAAEAVNPSYEPHLRSGGPSSVAGRLPCRPHCMLLSC
jgi:hypothetical protein